MTDVAPADAEIVKGARDRNGALRTLRLAPDRSDAAWAAR
jgi:hypothetical protein